MATQYSFSYTIIFFKCQKKSYKKKISWPPNIFSPTTLEKGILQLATKICKKTQCYHHWEYVGHIWNPMGTF